MVASVTTSWFQEAHIEPMLALMQRSFSIVPEAARPKDSPAFVKQMLSEANPAGPAMLAIAEEDGDWVGSVAGTAMRFRRTDGKIVTGYQIGYFIVDAKVQRQGLGRKLVHAVTEQLRGSSESFIYTYPNARSIVVFDRLQYERLTSVPTRIHIPTPATILVARSSVIKTVNGNSGQFKIISVDDARSVLDAAPNGDGEGAVGFLRDKIYFRWRFLGPDAERRYRYAAVTLEHGGTHLLALGRHAFKSINFAVLADVWPQLNTQTYPLIIGAAQAAGLHMKAPFVYLNSTLPSHTLLSVDVPEQLNPRPIKLLMHPDTTAITKQELQHSLAMTADWMGF